MSATIWFDPGKMTGWAWWTDDEDFASGQLPAEGVRDLLVNLVRDHDGQVTVGWEAFLILPGSRVKHDGSALQVIGVLRRVARDHQLEVLNPRQSSARNFGLLHLVKVGWSKRGHQHANDAAAHLLSWLAREKSGLPSSLLPKVMVGLDRSGTGTE